jgi:hypothetical protein
VARQSDDLDVDARQGKTAVREELFDHRSGAVNADRFSLIVSTNAGDHVDQGLSQEGGKSHAGKLGYSIKDIITHLAADFSG